MKNRIGFGLSFLLKGHAYLWNSYPALVANQDSSVTCLLQMPVDISVSGRGAMTCRLYTEIMLPPPHTHTLVTMCRSRPFSWVHPSFLLKGLSSSPRSPVVPLPLPPSLTFLNFLSSFLNKHSRVIHCANVPEV